MQFHHSPAVWAAHPTLRAAALYVAGVQTGGAGVAPDRLQVFHDRAAERLAGGSEAGLPEIQAWRRTFASMGLKPTQYRCAAEALLRRFRKEQTLPAVGPVIDLCNAVSIAFAIPIAVFDVGRVDTAVEVRPADGTEIYETFSGETEHPEPGEIVFADAAGFAHARRWTNRQSARSAVRPETRDILIVAEALHDDAEGDVARLADAVAAELLVAWPVAPRSALLTAPGSTFTFA